MKHKIITVLFFIAGCVIGRIAFNHEKNQGKIVVIIDLDKRQLESVVNKTGSPVRFESQMSQVSDSKISSWTFTLEKNP